MQKPNLDYINKLADGDDSFKENILKVLKEEYPLEVEIFQKNYIENNFTEIANNIHKIKYKLSLLGLEDDFNLATDFESQIKDKNTELYQDFNDILSKISLYLKNI